MYLQIAAIFCLASIVHFSVCDDDVHNFMDTFLIDRIFQTSKNSVPKHEFVAIEVVPEPEFSRNGERIAYGRMWMRSAFPDLTLWLYPLSSSMIEENTPVYYAKYSSIEPENVKFQQQFGAMERIGQLFENPEHWASLMIDFDISGKTRVNGHIASKALTIRSLPDHVVKEYLRTRRSIDEDEYYLSNSSYHVVYKTSDDIEEKNMLHAFNRTSLTKRSDRSIFQDIPYQLVAEILLFVDNKFYTKQGNDIDYTLQYLVAFWNGVDLKYRNIENPQISLHISAIIIGMEPRATPYIWRNSLREGFFDRQKALWGASSFFYSIKDKFPLNSYDMAVTMTSQELGESNGGQRVGGIAYTSSACKLPTFDRMMATAIVNDNGAFNGIMAAAHELGHIFGMEHDEAKSNSCKPTDGYIMSGTIRYSRNSLLFSTCSIDSFEYRLHNRELTCLYNQPTITDYSLPRIMPGKFKNLDEQCAGYGFRHFCEFGDTDICSNLGCSYSPHQCSKLPYPALAGTPCGSEPHMYCLQYRCTKTMRYSQEALRDLVTGTGWIDRGKKKNNSLKTHRV